MSGIAAKISNDKAKSQGLGTPDNPVKYLKQDYEKLKAKFLKLNKLFEDNTFSRNNKSLGINKLSPDSEKAKDIVWKRAKNLHNDPQFIVNGATHEDIIQGKLGNCWFVASIATLTENQDFLPIVVPGNQSFQKDYAGIFHFKFWQYGEWVDVVVDDFLPTKSGKLYFMKSLSRNEFWGALLEKAYAKLHGSYEALISGYAAESMQDFTGGTVESYYISDVPENLQKIIQKRQEANALLTCASIQSSDARSQASEESGVVTGHAYTICGIEKVLFQGGEENIIKLRNPWGKREWTGAWSDNAPEWKKVDPKTRRKLTERKDDGEFWMSFTDFIKHYRRVDICNINLSNAIKTKDKDWHETQFSGKWRKGVTAGGDKDGQTFWTNPQFWATLDTPDHNCRGSSNEPYCRVIISLMQKERRQKRLLKKEDFKIGFCLYKIPIKVDKSSNDQLDETFFKKHAPVEVKKCTDYREVSKIFKLPVGTYLIIPHTSKANQEAEFCLRVFTEKRIGAFGGIGAGINPSKKKTSLPDVKCQGEAPNLVDIDQVTLPRIPEVTICPGGIRVIDKETSLPDVKCQGEAPNLVDIDQVTLPRIPEVTICPGGIRVIDKEVTLPRIPEVTICPGGIRVIDKEKNELDVHNLKAVLNEILSKRCDIKSEGLSLTTCREIINLFDMDRTGTLSVEEFKVLWKTLEEHMEIFKAMDADCSGSMDAFEMRRALGKAGFRLGNNILEVIVQKYASSDLTIQFDDFIACVMRLQTLFKMFNLLDTNQSGFITLSLAEWLCVALA
uniref:Uncharacterized protein n=1 Tax=Leptobrachium leishanense TaxID=445787 RepID=A0A8C5QG96_9ANUR